MTGLDSTSGAPTPDFVIVGAQRASSTSLMRQLGGHPNIYIPTGETRYLRDPWFSMQSAAELTRAVATRKSNVLRRGIKCPDLLGLPYGPPRIRQALGTIDLIAVLRDPVDRAISAYFWGMQWGWFPVLDAERGLRAILRGGYSDNPRAAELLAFGAYGANVQRFYEYFPKERFHIVLDFELREDPQIELKDICSFLGVDASVAPVQPTAKRKVNEGVYSYLRLRWLALRHRYILRPYADYPEDGIFLQPARGLRGRVVNRGVSVIDRVVLRRILPNTRPQLSAELISDLRSYYRADVDLLESLLERDLSPWREGPTGHRG